MRWWDTNGDPALIKTKLKINKFHLEVVVRAALVRRSINFYLLHHHDHHHHRSTFFSLSLSKYFVRACEFGHSVINFGEWPTVGASFTWNEISNLCELLWRARVVELTAYIYHLSAVQIRIHLMDIKNGWMQGLMAINCIHFSILFILTSIHIRSVMSKTSTNERCIAIIIIIIK